MSTDCRIGMRILQSDVMDLELTDKVAIVTGSSRGLGLPAPRRSSRRAAA